VNVPVVADPGPTSLDGVFQALADPTRRAIVARLTMGPASVSDLARPFSMTLAGVLQHLSVLEETGLVTTQKQGRVRTCRIDPKGLRSAENWIADRRIAWEQRLDRLQTVLEDTEGE
jgi:DNA-binding transcriptional ArsR family regulator